MFYHLQVAFQFWLRPDVEMRDPDLLAGYIIEPVHLQRHKCQFRLPLALALLYEVFSHIPSIRFSYYKISKKKIQENL